MEEEEGRKKRKERVWGWERGKKGERGEGRRKEPEGGREERREGEKEVDYDTKIDSSGL